MSNSVDHLGVQLELSLIRWLSLLAENASQTFSEEIAKLDQSSPITVDWLFELKFHVSPVVDPGPNLSDLHPFHEI